MNRLRTVDGIERELGISRDWIEEEARAGRLNCVELPAIRGKLLFFHLDAFADEIARRAANEMLKAD